MNAVDNFVDLKLNFSQWLPANKNARILDFGCGDGRIIQFLLDHGYTNITGADIKIPNDLKFPSEKVSLIEIKDATEFLSAQKEKFDFIVAKDVIYYFNSREVLNILVLFKNALAPNGQIFFEIFNGSLFTGPYVKYKDIDIQLILTDISLKKLIEEAGLHLRAMQGSRQPKNSMKKFLFFSIHKLEQWVTRFIFLVERGKDEQNPKIYSRKIIAVAQKN